ncbi:MAG TPA: peptidoglycan-associated lipoprotein Pal [Candidatus Solibacter sp.]|nr:peptidoglycan-associated lipoprotein Pal [Candidatus Solibacter sp.]
MKHSNLKWLVFMVVPASVAFSVACHKEAAKAQPSIPPSQPAPTVAISANPANLQHGQTSTLTWQTSNASDVNISGLGTVPASGSRAVTPGQSATYDLYAKGPGGSASASARVTVNWPAASSQETPLSALDSWNRNSRDIYFDYDRFDVRSDQMADLQADAGLLQQYRELRVNIEGHCDERGSEEYNIALGAKRAESVQKALERLGVTNAQLQTISYGKERPFCDAHNEHCWQENRRDHFTSRQ